MILIFGGTTQGRVSVEVCDRAAKRFFYSTKGEQQNIFAANMIRTYGAMNCEDIVSFCKENHIELIVDAAHPFAEQLHQNIILATKKLDIPLIRFDRIPSKTSYEKAIYFKNIDLAIEHIKTNSLQNILALTGVKSAPLLTNYAKENPLTLRIVNRRESLDIIEDCSFPKKSIIFYDIEEGTTNDVEICKALKIEHILTKESGESGGFEKKVEVAKSLNIPIYIIERPAKTAATTTVYGEYGLRREIERLLPSYFALHSGYTTGSCATAAAKSALYTLITHTNTPLCQITLPNGEPIDIAISKTLLHLKEKNNISFAESSVIKDGGDDPDVTHNIEIVAKVAFNDKNREILISGGEGIGVVTLPGLGLEIGSSAINATPRQMIISNLRSILLEHNISKGVDVTISVPEGANIAHKTFNQRLGIVGGISILGTSGIVQPFSADAFLESIERQIEVVKALGYNDIIINSGAKSERHIKERYGSLPQQAYIQYGNLIGSTIELAAKNNIKNVVLGVMIGKAVKLANGATDTHSKRVVMEINFIKKVALDAGCSTSTIEAIDKITTARQLWDIIPKHEYFFFDKIVSLCYDTCKPLIPNGNLEVLLINDNGIL